MTKEEILKDMQKIMEKMRIAISNNHNLYKRMLHEGFDVLYSEALYDAGYRKEEESNDQ